MNVDKNISTNDLAQLRCNQPCVFSFIGAGKINQNWAMRPTVPVASIGQMFESIAQALHPRNLSFEFCNVLRGQFFYLPAGALAVVPQSQQITDTLDREAKLPGAMYEA